VRSRPVANISPRPAMIYLARARVPGTNPLATKVGVTTNLADRLQALQAKKSPWGTDVTFATAVHIGYGVAGESEARAVERALHLHFNEQRAAAPPDPKTGHQRNEWFRLTVLDVAAIHGTVAVIRAELARMGVRPGRVAGQQKEAKEVRRRADLGVNTNTAPRRAK